MKHLLFIIIMLCCLSFIAQADNLDFQTFTEEVSHKTSTYTPEIKQKMASLIYPQKNFVNPVFMSAFAAFWFFILFTFAHTVICNFRKKEKTNTLSKIDIKNFNRAINIRMLIVIFTIITYIDIFIWHNLLVLIICIVLPHLAVFFGIKGPGVITINGDDLS